MQALAKWLKFDPQWLRYGGVLEDSFVANYMSLSEEATVRAVVGAFWRYKSQLFALLLTTQATLKTSFCEEGRML